MNNDVHTNSWKLVSCIRLIFRSVCVCACTSMSVCMCTTAVFTSGPSPFCLPAPSVWCLSHRFSEASLSPLCLRNLPALTQ